jgi:hypothetical protein
MRALQLRGRVLLVTPPSKPGKSHCGVMLIGTFVASSAATARVTAFYPSLQFVLEMLTHDGIQRLSDVTGVNTLDRFP